MNLKIQMNLVTESQVSSQAGRGTAESHKHGATHEQAKSKRSE